jgi:phosphoglycolate phosphatase
MMKFTVKPQYLYHRQQQEEKERRGQPLFLTAKKLVNDEDDDDDVRISNHDDIFVDATSESRSRNPDNVVVASSRDPVVMSLVQDFISESNITANIDAKTRTRMEGVSLSSKQAVEAMISFVVRNQFDDGLQKEQQKQQQQQPLPTKMIVFDKDGTLGDCNASLRRWVQHIVRMIHTHLKDDDQKEVVVGGPLLIEDFYQKVGWDSIQDQVVPSAPVAAGTWDQICEIVYRYLLEHKTYFLWENRGDDDDTSSSTILHDMAKEWTYGLDDLHSGDDPVIDDLKQMMEECHRMGYLVAVCTSDDRVSTDIAMKRWGVDQVVDVSICGDEVDGNGKPSAVPLQLLCKRATTYLKNKQQQTEDSSSIGLIQPQNCIMVGDTTADTDMAKAADAGFCVGVLTGSGTSDQLLENGAHLILPNVGHVPNLLETFNNLRQFVLNKSISLSG